MGPDEFEFLRTFLKDHSGLVVTPDKMYLIETRLMPVARKHGYNNIAELVGAHRERGDQSIATDISEAMNTHESLFFRDNTPFELFETTLLPALLQRRQEKKKFRVWCAACSSGQEPYSLAMMFNENAAKLQGWRPEIIATDISHAVLDRAAEGVYSQFEVQRGLPVKYLVKYFKQDGEYWQLNTDVRDMVKFQHFNLMKDPRTLGSFDVVFCRNVLIYFDVETKSLVMDGIQRVLAKDGVLFLGSAESTIGITEAFWPVKAGRGVYKHTDGPACLMEDES
ncbi:CheR family methyltransferase [Pseudomonadota bacterium]